MKKVLLSFLIIVPLFSTGYLLSNTSPNGVLVEEPVKLRLNIPQGTKVNCEVSSSFKMFDYMDEEKIYNGEIPEFLKESPEHNESPERKELLDLSTKDEKEKQKSIKSDKIVKSFFEKKDKPSFEGVLKCSQNLCVDSVKNNEVFAVSTESDYFNFNIIERYIGSNISFDSRKPEELSFKLLDDSSYDPAMQKYMLDSYNESKPLDLLKSIGTVRRKYEVNSKNELIWDSTLSNLLQNEQFPLASILTSNSLNIVPMPSQPLKVGESWNTKLIPFKPLSKFFLQQIPIGENERFAKHSAKIGDLFQKIEDLFEIKLTVVDRSEGTMKVKVEQKTNNWLINFSENNDDIKFDVYVGEQAEIEFHKLKESSVAAWYFEGYILKGVIEIEEKTGLLKESVLDTNCGLVSRTPKKNPYYETIRTQFYGVECTTKIKNEVQK